MPETTEQQLADARAALHRLVTGGQRVAVRDADGRQVTYSETNREQLEAYIAGLEAKLQTGKSYRPIAVRF